MVPQFLQGDAWKTHLAAVALGCAILAFGGFKVGGWYTNAQANVFANKSAEAAVNKALTPVCAASFAALATPAQWADFKAKESYSRTEVVKTVVKIPGTPSLDYTLSGDCADLIAEASAKSAAK